MKLTPKKKKIIDAVIERLRKFPKAYNQKTWGMRISKSIAPCGTACCIAGDIALVTDIDPKCLIEVFISPNDIPDRQIRSKVDFFGIDIQDYGALALGLSDDEANTLFTPEPFKGDIFNSYWPEPFRSQWKQAGRLKEKQATVAIEYLTYIRDTGDVLCEKHPERQPV